jgi:hypothetical protein
MVISFTQSIGKHSQPACADQKRGLFDKNLCQSQSGDVSKSIFCMLGHRYYDADHSAPDFFHAILYVQEGSHKFQCLLALDTCFALFDKREDDQIIGL